MPTPEQIERMRQRNRARRESGVDLGGVDLGGVSRAIARKLPSGNQTIPTPLGPLKMDDFDVLKPVVKPVADRLMNTWRKQSSNFIQDDLELREVAEERGIGASVLHQMKQLGHRAGVLEDPSLDTELGSRVNLAFEEQEKDLGRNLTLSEKYDIERDFQDEAAPWLAERQQIGPVSFSNRMFIEGPAEAAGIAAEIGLTGGLATAGRGFGKGMAAYYAGQQGVKAGAGRAVGRGVAMALKLPAEIDSLAGAVMSVGGRAAFRIGKQPFRPVIGATRLSSRAVKSVVNRFRARAIDQYGEGSKELIDQTGRQLGEQLADSGMWLPMNLYDEAARPLSSFEHYADEAIDGFRGRDAAKVWPQERNILNIASPEVVTQAEIRGARTQRGVGKIKAFIEDAANAVSEFQILGRKPLQRVAKYDPAELPEEVGLGRIGKAIGDKIRAWDDKAATAMDAYKASSTERTRFLVSLLLSNKVFTVNRGGVALRNVAKIFDNDPNAALESGALLENLVRGSTGEVLAGGKVPQGNLTLSKGILDAGEGFTDDMGSGVLVSNNYVGPTALYRNPITNQTERIGLDLDPGFGDVVERLGLYSRKLAGIHMELPKGAGQSLGKETITALEALQEIAEIAAKMEDQLGRLGVKVHTARGVHYRVIDGINAGSPVFPRGVLGKVERGALPNSQITPEVTVTTKKGPAGLGISSESVYARDYLSQAEGMAAERWYIHPADAIGDRADFVTGRIRDDYVGKYIVQQAEKHNVRFGTVRELLGDRYTQFEESFKRLQKQIGYNQRRAISRLAARTVYVPKAKASIAEMDEAVRSLEQAITLDPRLRDDALTDLVSLMQKWFEHLDKRLDIDLAKITRSIFREGEDAAQLKQFKDLKADLIKQRNILKEEVTDRMAQLNGVGLEGHFFPVRFRDSIYKATEEGRKLRQAPGGLAMVNTLMRMFGATGDMSAIGIQGNVAIFSDAAQMALESGKKLVGGGADMRINRTGNGFTAATASMQAITNDGANIVAEHMWRRHHIALQEGVLTPEQWAQKGLAILEHAPDMYVGKGIFRVPGIRRFDRSFTHFGNMMRHSIADSELKLMMASKGKTAQQLMDSGELEAIATAANLMTGIGKRGYMGDVGQLLFFAPRFMHARMAFARDAMMGILPGTNKTAQRRMAKQYMARFIGTASTLTFAINEAQGHPTDINPFLRDQSTGRWYFNPNFMRIHVGQLDISLFGPWDSFLRIVAVPGFLLANGYGAWKDDVDYGKMEIFKDLRRIISAPITTTGLNVLLGEDAMGQRTVGEDSGFLNSRFDSKTLGTVLSNFVPFAWDELVTGDTAQGGALYEKFGEGLMQTARGDLAGGAGAMTTAGAQVALNIIGAKSSYESVGETLNRVHAELLALGPDDPRLRADFGVGPENGNRMTEEEYASWWGDAGKKWYENVIGSGGSWDIELSFSNAFSNETPSWDRVASDIQNNMRRRLDEGGFSEVMTADEMLKIEKNVKERVEKSAAEYSRYKVEKDALEADEVAALRKAEDEFIAGGAEDFGAYMKTVRATRKAYSEKRRALTDEKVGKYKGVTELFNYANATALGNLSTYDADVYHHAQASYYEYLYEDTRMPDGTVIPSIVDDDTSIVDWDLREQKMGLWASAMREKYPNLREDQIARYRMRIEQSTKREAPPIARMLLEGQDYISQTKISEDGRTYYELEKNAIQNAMRYTNTKTPMVQAQKIHTQWKNASKPNKVMLEASHGWLKLVSPLERQETARAFRNDTRIEGILVLLGKRGSYQNLQTARAREVYSIWTRHLTTGGPHLEGDKLQHFVADVINGEDLSAYR